MNLGFGEILILALIVLLFFGAGKIPKLMGDMASGIKAFKKGMADEKSDSAPPPASAATTAPETPPPGTPPKA
ncbi:MAG: twin-arginine translocase TatA/TatE family subunit [Magnetospirillum sp.]|jgi:sec-independent protein translocase protein TatA|nr:twin-arginine translocase TatA/TatE family subunit [Magnetospirillum sp.]